MSNHDTPQIDLVLGDEQDTSCQAASENDGTPADDSALNFKISVRKVQVKVQARGVLAE